MWIFFKAQVSSLTATLVDFFVTVCLVEIFGIYYIEATIIGALAGAVTNFLINKYWSFENADNNFKKQSLRYLTVWLGSVALNTSGMYLLTHFFGISYLVSKVVVALSVGIGFNYTLQKQYVFNTNEKILSK